MAKSIDIGAVCEHKFAAEALLRGQMISWPSSQMHPYDVILDSGKARHRIQVKGTEKKSNKVAFQFRMISGRGTRRRYTKSDTDFIVLHLLHYDLWYIFPVEEVRTGVTICPTNPSCRYAKYAGAWDLLE